MAATEQSKDGIPDEIEYRLDRWGKMARGRYDMPGCGGEENVIYRLIREGATGAAQSTEDWASEHLPDDVMETDAAVARLPYRYKEAIKVHYMWGRNLPTQVKARMLETSPATFFLRVNAAKVGVYMTLIARV